MTKIIKVALAGATGNLGPAILDQLIKADFEVTVLTRASSNHKFPSQVTVKPVDYTLDSVTEALKGQDAVISAFGSIPVDVQLLLVKAAAKAGVTRFIPSEFGSNTVNPKAAKIPVYKDKVAVQEALKEEAKNGDMTYTFLLNGPFLDWGIQVGFIMNLKEKSIDLFDGGDRPFSTTTLDSVGKAVVGVLHHPEETKNRVVYVQDTAITLKKLAEMGKKATGGSEGWKENVVSTDEVLETAWNELKKDKPDHNVFVYNFLKAVIWGDGYGSLFEKEQLDNEQLGMKEMSDEEIQEVVNRYAK